MALYSSTTAALEGGKLSAARPGRTLPPVPIVQEAVWKISSTPGFDPEPVPTELPCPRSEVHGHIKYVQHRPSPKYKKLSETNLPEFTSWNSYKRPLSKLKLRRTRKREYDILQNHSAATITTKPFLLFGALKRADVHKRLIYLVLVYLVSAFVPSLTACLASSPGNNSRTAVCISRLVIVERLL